MYSLIDLIITTVNNLISSFNNMTVVSGLNLFNLLLITGFIIVVFDVVRRMAR